MIFYRQRYIMTVFKKQTKNKKHPKKHPTHNIKYKQPLRKVPSKSDLRDYKTSQTKPVGFVTCRIIIATEGTLVAFSTPDSFSM